MADSESRRTANTGGPSFELLLEQSTTPPPGTRIRLEGESFLIGRTEDCDMVLDDAAVSRRHAEIKRRGESWELIDQGSSNGTFVGAERIEKHVLGIGDRFRVGSTVIAFRRAVGSPVEASEPKPKQKKAAEDKSEPPPIERRPESPSAEKEAVPPSKPKPPAEPKSVEQPHTSSREKRAEPRQESAPGPSVREQEASPAPSASQAEPVEVLAEAKVEGIPKEPAKPWKPIWSADDDGSHVADLPPAEGPLEDVFARWGAAQIAKGNEPFLISDPTVAWYVETGKVELFTVSLNADNEPEGARSHFLSVEAGQLMFGMDFVGYGLGAGFMAVGRVDTNLRRLRVSELRVLAQDERYTGLLDELVDTWVEGLSRALTESISPGPLVEHNLKPNDEAELENQHRARSTKAPLWIEVFEGDLLFIGWEQVVSEAEVDPGDRAASFAQLVREAQQERAFFPVTPDSWVEAANFEDIKTRIKAWDGKDVINDPAMWIGLQVFHRVLCQCEFINKKLEVVDEFNRLKSKAEYSEAAQRAGVDDIAGVLEAPSVEGLQVEIGRGDPMLEACQLVGSYNGMDIDDHPEADKNASFNDRIAAIAKASRCRTRPIALREDWWNGDQGPVLARWEDEESERPIALIPKSSSSYMWVDPATGKRGTVTEKVAMQIAAFGIVFYRPFPDGPLGAMDLIKFGARGLGKDVRMVIAMGIALGMLGALTPYFTGRLFDGAIPQADRGLLLQFTGGLFMAAIVSAAFKITQSMSVLRMQGKMDYSVQAALWDRLLNLPSTAFRNYTAGDLADRAGGVDAIRKLLAGAGISSILGSLSSIFYIFLMFKYSLLLAAIGMGLTIVYVGCTTTANYLKLRHERRELKVRGRITGMVLQFISGVSKLRVAGAENHAFRVWARDYSLQRRIEFAIGRIENALQTFGSGFPVLASIAIFYAMMTIQEAAVAKGQPPPLTTGDFIAFNSAFTAFLTATQALGDASMDMLRIVPIFQRLKPIVTTPAELDESRTYPGKLRGGIEVSHVSFRYSEDGPWVLDDLSVTIRPGEFAAFVGGSGCGKSTLMRLLLGFETPQKGSIYYDGQDLASLDLREIRMQIGVVLQSSGLLPTDIYRNIVGSTGLPVGAAWEAAALAGLIEDIQALPMGMHTYISEGGGGLSGGQKQKILIARALVRKPRVLIFDEATSALDNRSQATVTESMEQLQASRIVIAHRLSTIVNADRICYLEGGRVAEQGSSDELMELDGLFAALARRQMA